MFSFGYLRGFSRKKVSDLLVQSLDVPAVAALLVNPDASIRKKTLERVVEEISFEGPNLENKNVVIDAKYVRNRLGEILQKEDLSKFIL